MRFLSLLLITITACGGAARPSPSPAAPPAKPVATAGSTTGDLPIAQYLGSDELTGQRVAELLRAAGIESSAGGSLGYSVWVSGADREKARQILMAAASSECLEVTIFDDQGALVPDTQPARCMTTASAPVNPSKK